MGIIAEILKALPEIIKLINNILGFAKEWSKDRPSQDIAKAADKFAKAREAAKLSRDARSDDDKKKSAEKKLEAAKDIADLISGS